MTKKTLLDIVERVVWTAAQAFAATWVVTARFDAETFAIAGTAAAVSAAKCIVATRVGDSATAAAIPGHTGP